MRRRGDEVDTPLEWRVAGLLLRLALLGLAIYLIVQDPW